MTEHMENRDEMESVEIQSQNGVDVEAAGSQDGARVQEGVAGHSRDRVRSQEADRSGNENCGENQDGE